MSKSTDEEEYIIEWGVKITPRNGKFIIEHTYMPKPNVEEPSSFDERNAITKKVGEANTIKEAELIKQKYEKKLAAEAENEEDDED